MNGKDSLPLPLSLFRFGLGLMVGGNDGELLKEPELKISKMRKRAADRGIEGNGPCRNIDQGHTLHAIK